MLDLEGTLEMIYSKSFNVQVRNCRLQNVKSLAVQEEGRVVLIQQGHLKHTKHNFYRFQLNIKLCQCDCISKLRLICFSSKLSPNLSDFTTEVCFLLIYRSMLGKAWLWLMKIFTRVSSPCGTLLVDIGVKRSWQSRC